MQWLHRLVTEFHSTKEERTSVWPCDRVLPDADIALFRAIDVSAPVSVVFRWLCQFRVAPYSYDWIDNLGRRSPRTLTPGLDDLSVGQRFMTMFELVAFERDDHITIRSTHRLFGDVAVTYRVRAADCGTRLAVKLLVRHRRDPLGFVWSKVLPAGDLVMMRKQLRTIAALSARSSRVP